MSEIFDPSPCFLGEGPLWHPVRQCLFWFDIVASRMHARIDGTTRTWQFAENVSAAGWIDETRLLIASERRLFEFDVESGSDTTLGPLEEDRADTRSNDGRADPFGGFWIGTMSKEGTPGKGRIYRYYRGEIRVLYEGIGVPNTISFAPDGVQACYGDSLRKKVWRQRLSPEDGWPVGEPEVFLDLTSEGMVPDGAVFDAEGNLWCAIWEKARVAVFDRDGNLARTLPIPAENTTCPAFGGTDLSDLFCTSARQGLSDDVLENGRAHGATFRVPRVGRGLAEHRVIL